MRTFGCCLILVLAGCGGSNLPEGETGSVSGTLTSNGQTPPDGATVVFLHQEKGLAASGTVGADGRYSLKMRGGGAILTGKYFVGVTPPTVEMTPEEQAAAATGGPIKGPEWPDFPPKYLIPESSGIEFEVKPGSNTFDLDMKAE